MAVRDVAGRLVATIANSLPVVLDVKGRESRYLPMTAYQARLCGTTPDYGCDTRRIDADVMAAGAGVGEGSG